MGLDLRFRRLPWLIVKWGEVKVLVVVFVFVCVFMFRIVVLGIEYIWLSMGQAHHGHSKALYILCEGMTSATACYYGRAGCTVG